MNGIKVLLQRHPLGTYFVLAFVISWGGVLVVTGGPAGVPGTKEETDRLFPLAFLAMLAGPSLYDRTGSLLVGMLMHSSLTASLIILRPAASGVALVIYELAWAGALWAVMAIVVLRARRPMSRATPRRDALPDAAPVDTPA